MKKRFSEEQIIGFLREVEAGMPVKDMCRKHGFSEASYYLRLDIRYPRLSSRCLNALARGITSPRVVSCNRAVSQSPDRV